MTRELNRRKLLGITAAGASASLAGCFGLFVDGRGVPGTDNREPDTNSTDGNGDGSSMEPAVDVPDAVDSYLQDNSANLYDGPVSAVDETGNDEVTIAVGAGSGFAFKPAAVAVDAGTEITWEWTGAGGGHNVVAADDSDAEFNSGETVSTEGTKFTQTFDSAGNQLYFCTPHRGAGMHGAVIVQE